MGWSGYSNYSGDGTQTCHYKFLTLSGAAKNDDEIYDGDWLTYKGTIIPKDRISLFKKGLPKVLKKMPKTKFWNEDNAIEWQMLLHLFMDNKIKVPTIVKKNGITAAEYLMEDHARDFDNPQARRYHLRKFIEKAKKL